MSPVLHWWLKTDAGLAARAGIGIAIFAMLAIIDLLRRGHQATRWREYLFLAVAAIFAMAYGAINDWIAASISWEYFYYGKGIDQQIGPHVPPNALALHRAACEVGLKATWSAGLIVGVALLLANNPSPKRSPLSYQILLGLLPNILLVAACFAALGALAGTHGWIAWTSSDLRALVREDLFRPRRFLAVYGMNLGGYIGGAMATIAAVGWVVRRRSQPASSQSRR